MESGSQGHTQRAWVDGKQVMGQGEKMGTESDRQGGYIVRIPRGAHGGSERHILGKDKDPGPSLCRSSKKPGPISHLG